MQTEAKNRDVIPSNFLSFIVLLPSRRNEMFQKQARKPSPNFIGHSLGSPKLQSDLPSSASSVEDLQA